MPRGNRRRFKPVFEIKRRLMTVGELATFFAMSIDVVVQWTHELTFPCATMTPQGAAYAIDEVMHWLSKQGVQ